MAKGLNFLTTKVYLTPLASMTSLSVPKIADITGTGGVDISAQLLKDTKLPVYGDDKTVTEMSITEGEDIEAIAGYTTTGWSLTWFHDYTSAGALSSTDLTTVFTTPGAQFALTYRLGLPFSTALAVGQKVHVWPVSVGITQEILSFDGYFKARNNLHNLGGSTHNVALVT